MKKIIILLLSTCAAFYTHAQGYYAHYKDDQPIKLGIGLNAGAAVGAISSYFPGSGGFSLTLEAPIKHTRASVVFTTGYTFYASNNGYDVGYGYDYGYTDYGYGDVGYVNNDVAAFVPVELGLKVYVVNKLFIQGDAGVSFNVNTYPENYTNKTTSFIYSPAIGYSFPMGYRSKSTFDLSLAYESRPASSFDYPSYNQIYIRAAFNFGL